MGVNSVPIIRRFSEFKFVDDTALSQEDLTMQSQRVRKIFIKGREKAENVTVDISQLLQT